MTDTSTDKSSSQYATLPAGTKIKWGRTGETEDKFKPLDNCKAIGAMGFTGGTVDCTTLKDTNTQSVSALPEGPEKSLVFVDHPDDESFADFLTAATKRETIQFHVSLPNGRVSISIIALTGWELNEISAPANEVMQITVKGKQNDITWSIKKESKSHKTEGVAK